MKETKFKKNIDIVIRGIPIEAWKAAAEYYGCICEPVDPGTKYRMSHEYDFIHRTRTKGIYLQLPIGLTPEKVIMRARSYRPEMLKK